ncbi:hypothetical protein [Hymenobacter psoromatis]|uniref:hypothetical protein n=1 Tax=Hymenobacter psoromatis TaxID=1484116 RepID=UPI001CBDADF9|nr:hypothetical protein [Hymenobacter psoromatis]
MRRALCLGQLAALLLLAGRASLATPLPPPDSARTAPPRLTVGLSTANRTTYLQRAPQAADDRGYLGTTLTYQAPSGFVASGYLNHSYAYTYLHEPFYNFGELMAGWQSVSNSDTYWTVQYTHLFAYGESALVQASLRNDLSASLTQFFGLVTASVSADLFLGNKTDFVLTLNASHHFQLPVLAHDTLSIEPTVEFGAGSQHFYAASLGKTTVVKTRRKGTTTTFTEPATPGFSSLGYTLSLPVSFAAGRYVVAATPSYLVPLHIPNGGNTSAFFYGTLAVSRTFW